MTPRDPWQFVIRSLTYIREANVTNIPRYGVRGGEGEVVGLTLVCVCVCVHACVCVFGLTLVCILYLRHQW